MDKIINNLKSSFQNFRDSPLRAAQPEIVNHIINSDKKYIVVKSPVGSGKSLAVMMSGLYHDSFCYLCSSIQLQDQLEHDFPECMIMKGRSNFTCNSLPYRTAADCYHSKTCPCDHVLSCHYKTHKLAVIEHPYKILNYHYIIHEANYAGAFTGFPVMLCDEADVLEQIITGFISISISGKLISKLRLSKPKYITNNENGVESWIVWINNVVRKLYNYINTLEEDLSCYDEKSDNCIRLQKDIDSNNLLYNRLKSLANNIDTTWICEIDKFYGNITFKPIWLTPELSQQYFFRHASKFVLLSGTFPTVDILAKSLGISESEIDFIEIASDFPRENNRIVIRPVANMKYQFYDAELPKLIYEINRILSQNPSSKGVIHTASYKLANDIIQNVGSSRLLTHGPKDRIDVLAMHKSSPLPTVLVSPSMDRGVDLPGILCEFQIIAKAPFASLADKLVSARKNSGDAGIRWYLSQTAQSIEQMCGRGVRSKTDTCVTYLLDTCIKDLVMNNRELFSNHFLKCLTMKG